MVEAFTTMVTGRNPLLRALVVVISGLTEPSLLDEVHVAVKSMIVERGLMIGQFHPRCTERAVRNSGFAVGRSPVPMLAVRHMAVHDIVFLDRKREWFAAYEDRFKSRYGPDSLLDPLYRAKWARARARFGSPVTAETVP